MNDELRNAMNAFIRGVQQPDGRGHETAATLGTGEREHMIESLRRAIRYQRRLALLPLALAVALFGVAVFFVFTYAEQPSAVAAIFGASGLSLSVPFLWATRTLRALWTYEALAAALPRLTNEAIAEFLRSIIDS